MIAKLSGEIVDIHGNLAIVDVGGLGYGVLVSNENLGLLQQGVGVSFYIYEHIREQEHSLYGFSSIEDKMLFELLLSVNGVGPKAALAIFNLASSDRLRQEIASSNIAFLTQASGVGKKAAERVVVDLQDKVGEVTSGSIAGGFVSRNSEAVDGLIALGYKKDQAVQMLQNVKAETPEEQIKLALRNAK